MRMLLLSISTATFEWLLGKHKVLSKLSFFLKKKSKKQNHLLNKTSQKYTNYILFQRKNDINEDFNENLTAQCTFDAESTHRFEIEAVGMVHTLLSFLARNVFARATRFNRTSVVYMSSEKVFFF